VSDAPADYIAAMLRAIVGIEIPVSSLTGKWKVSQNRNAADREGVARGLAEQGAADAAAMAKLVKP
jgi:transcriptional regulator